MIARRQLLAHEGVEARLRAGRRALRELSRVDADNQRVVCRRLLDEVRVLRRIVENEAARPAGLND